MNIAVVGGGVSGLTTAFWIKKLRPQFNITILEKDEILGGKLKTENFAGFKIEVGGNGFLNSKPDMLELIDAIKANDVLLKSEDTARKRFIYDKSQLFEMPSTPKEFFKTKILSSAAKLRIVSEFIIPSKKVGNENETVRAFGERRLGKAFTDLFLDAMTAGIFASTPDKLSLSAAFPAIAKLEREYGGLFKGMRAKKKLNKDVSAGPGGVLMSFYGGMGAFIKRLAGAFEHNVKLNTTVVDIARQNGKWIVKTENETLIYDAVILSCPAFETSKILKNLDQSLSGELRKIEYSPVAVVALGYDNIPEKLDGFGLLTTSRSNTQVLGILWDSSVFKDRAEEPKQLMRVMIGGQRQTTLALKDDETLTQIAISGVLQTMHKNEEPMLTKVYKWYKAIPNYSVGHEALVATIMDMTKEYNGLYLGGNAYYGVGMNECAKYAKELALNICNKI
ncbi:MAG: protoporphyrinogen oxidase [Pseudomonadota bacterium]